MEIFGAVMAKNNGHAFKILEGLQREYILDCFAVGKEIDVSNPRSFRYLDAFVDNDGYLTLKEDMGEKTIQELIPALPGYKLYNFTADYTEVY